MLVLKILLLFIAFTACYVFRDSYEKRFYNDGSNGLIIAAVIGTFAETVVDVLIITQNWNEFAIPKILLILTISLFILFYNKRRAALYRIGILVTIVAYYIAEWIHIDL